jgi:hypothetical protein
MNNELTPIEGVEIEGVEEEAIALPPPRKRKTGEGFAKSSTVAVPPLDESATVAARPFDDSVHLLKVTTQRSHTNPGLPITMLLIPSHIPKAGGGMLDAGFKPIGFIAGINQVAASEMESLKRGYADMFASGTLEDLGGVPFGDRPVGEQRLLVQNTEDVELLLQWRDETNERLVRADINRIFAGIESLAEFAEAV